MTTEIALLGIASSLRAEARRLEEIASRIEMAASTTARIVGELDKVSRRKEGVEAP